MKWSNWLCIWCRWKFVLHCWFTKPFRMFCIVFRWIFLALNWLAIPFSSPSQVKESYNESDRIQSTDKIRRDSGLWTDIQISSVGIRWDPSVRIQKNLLVGFDRPLLIIISFNKLVLGANLRDRSKPTDRFHRIPTLKSYRICCRIFQPDIIA